MIIRMEPDARHAMLFAAAAHILLPIGKHRIHAAERH